MEDKNKIANIENNALAKTQQIFGLQISVFEKNTLIVASFLMLFSMIVGALTCLLVTNAGLMAFLLFLASCFLGIACSIFAAIIVINLYEHRVKQSEQQLLAENLETTINSSFNQLCLPKVQNEFRKIESEYSSGIFRNFENYLPSKHFPDSIEAKPKYIKFLTESLKNSHSYSFKGTLGLWLPIYLEKYETKDNLNVNALLFDVKNEKILKSIVQGRYSDIESSSEDEKLKKLKSLFFQIVIALYDVGKEKQISIEIGLHNDYVFYLSEIFEEEILISFYEVKHKGFPPSFCYKKNLIKGGENIFYEAFHNDFEKTWNLADKKITLNNHTTERTLKEFLKKIGWNENTETLSELRTNFALEKEKRLTKIPEV